MLEKYPSLGARISGNSGKLMCPGMPGFRTEWDFTWEKCFELTIEQNLKIGIWHFGLCGNFPILDFDTNVKIQSCTTDGSVSNCNHSSAILCVFWTSFEILWVQTIDNKDMGHIISPMLWGKICDIDYIIWFMLFCKCRFLTVMSNEAAQPSKIDSDLE